jgi:hypothetical protein
VEASEILVGSLVFKTSERRAASLAGSIPVRLRHLACRHLACRACWRADLRLYVGGHLATVTLRLLSDRRRVIAEVWDEAPGFPAPRRAGSAEESGRGLQLVDALTGGRWGWQAVTSGTKVVWAELAAG